MQVQAMKTSQYRLSKSQILGLAEWGRKEIQIAETEMPGLMALRANIQRQTAAKRRTYCWLFTHDRANCGINRNID